MTDYKSENTNHKHLKKRAGIPSVMPAHVHSPSDKLEVFSDIRSNYLLNHNLLTVNYIETLCVHA